MEHLQPFVLFMCLLISTSKGQSQLQYANPPGGTPIAHLEGEAQITINCNVTDLQLQTQSLSLWFIRSYNGISGLQQITAESGNFNFANITGDSRPQSNNITSPHYRNFLIIVKFTPDLDGTTIYCGTGSNSQLAEYPVKLLVRPSAPYNLSVVNTSATWVALNWEAPILRGVPEVSSYNVTAKEDAENITIMMVTGYNETSMNFTGLSPKTNYVLTVTGIAEFLDQVITSPDSDPVNVTTYTTAPALICNTTPTASFGDTINLTVNWTYEHMGGLTVTNLTINYTYNSSKTIQQGITLTEFNASLQPDDVTVDVPKIVPGYQYIFHVTADNEIGLGTVECPPVIIDIHSFQLVLELPNNQHCETWREESTTTRVKQISEQLVNRCGCNITKHQIVNQTLKCSNESKQAVAFRANLLSTDNAQHFVEKITHWLSQNASVSIQGQTYNLNRLCPVSISSLEDHLLQCEERNSNDGSDEGGFNLVVVLVGVLAAVVGILLLVVLICLTAVCCLCCDNILKPRTTTKIEVELSAWDVADRAVSECDCEEQSPDANDYEVVADLVNNPVYHAVEQARIFNEQAMTLQCMYEPPNTS